MSEDKTYKETLADMEHQSDIRSMGALMILVALVMFVAGMILGSKLGADSALRKEHCTAAGGTVQSDGSCAVVTITPVKP